MQFWINAAQCASYITEFRTARITFIDQVARPCVQCMLVAYIWVLVQELSPANVYVHIGSLCNSISGLLWQFCLNSAQP